MPDPFQGRAPSEGAPYDNAMTIAPSDTTDLPVIPAAIYIPHVLAEDGSIAQNSHSLHNIRIQLQNGEAITILSAGTVNNQPVLLPFRPVRILATGTSVSTITLVW